MEAGKPKIRVPTDSEFGEDLICKVKMLHMMNFYISERNKVSLILLQVKMEDSLKAYG